MMCPVSTDRVDGAEMTKTPAGHFDWSRVGLALLAPFQLFEIDGKRHISLSQEVELTVRQRLVLGRRNSLGFGGLGGLGGDFHVVEKVENRGGNVGAPRGHPTDGSALLVRVTFGMIDEIGDEALGQRIECGCLFKKWLSEDQSAVLGSKGPANLVRLLVVRARTTLHLLHRETRANTQNIQDTGVDQCRTVRGTSTAAPLALSLSMISACAVCRPWKELSDRLQLGASVAALSVVAQLVLQAVAHLVFHCLEICSGLVQLVGRSGHPDFLVLQEVRIEVFDEQQIGALLTNKQRTAAVDQQSHSQSADKETRDRPAWNGC